MSKAREFLKNEKLKGDSFSPELQDAVIEFINMMESEEHPMEDIGSFLGIEIARAVKKTSLSLSDTKAVLKEAQRFMK